MEKKPSRKKLPDSGGTAAKKQNQLYRFSNMGIQMGLVIFLGAWGGTSLDAKYSTDPLWTVVLSLLGVFIAMYLVFKELAVPKK